MITPDDLAARFAPPLTTGPQHARALEFTDGAYQLAERVLDLLPRGHHADAAIDALERASHLVQAGLAAKHDEETAAEADVQVPSVLGGPAADGDRALGEGLDLNVSLWRAGVLHGRLMPLARLAAVVLAECTDGNGFIADVDQPSVEDLCLRTGLDIANLLHAVEELAVTGWVSRHNDGGPTRYQLRMPAPSRNSR